MEDNKDDKYKTVKIISHINEILTQTEITQFYKNTSKSPIELLIELPELANSNITKFEMTLDKKKIISKIVEKEKGKEKYNDTISTGNYGFLSFNEDNKNTVCLGNIPSQKEIELKTYYIGNLVCNDWSYLATILVIFPQFIIEDPKNKKEPEYLDKYTKKNVQGKIYINTFSKITRLIFKGSSNFDKIEKKYGKDCKSVEIDIIKNTFSEIDIPGFILFRTKK